LKEVSFQDFVHSVAGLVTPICGAIAAFFVALKAYLEYIKFTSTAAPPEARPPRQPSPMRALVLALLAGAILGAALTLLAAHLLLPPPTPSVAIIAPRSGSGVAVKLDPSGSARFDVAGTSSNVFGKAHRHIYLLVHPKEPLAAGWWIQPAVVLERSGKWTAIGWIGSNAFRPGAGHTFQIVAVAAAERSPLPKNKTGEPWIEDYTGLDPLAASEIVDVRVSEVR
jgi:hypothetical protein